MIAATYLLFLLGLLGAADILFYHSISHGIREHEDAQQELWIHSLRGPTYAILFVTIPNFQMQGAYFWALILLLAIDVAISIWDFAIEGESRRFLGGLPAGEYVLHMVMAMVFGAMASSVLYEAWEWARMPTQITYEPAMVPRILRAIMALMAVCVLWSGIQDARAALRLRATPK